MRIDKQLALLNGFIPCMQINCQSLAQVLPIRVILCLIGALTDVVSKDRKIELWHRLIHNTNHSVEIRCRLILYTILSLGIEISVQRRDIAGDRTRPCGRH